MIATEINIVVVLSVAARLMAVDSDTGRCYTKKDIGASESARNIFNIGIESVS